MSEIVQQVQQIFVLLDDGTRRALKHVGLTPTQYQLMRVLGERGNGGLAVSRLAEALLCTRGNVTRLVQRMEEHGLVSTRGDEHDQRLVLVELTDEGSSRWRAARKHLKVYDERRFGRLSPDERTAFHSIAGAVIDHLTEDLAADDA